MPARPMASPHAEFALRGASHAIALLRRISRLWHRARAVDELARLSDARLRDIGVERFDVEALIDRELTRFKAR